MSLVRRIASKLRPSRKAESTEIAASDDESRRRTQQKVFTEIDVPRTLLTNTVVAPPHNVSNLRRVHVRTPHDETPAERAYREAYDEIQQWNHHYWIEHNQLFQRERARFVMENSSEGNSQHLDANKMAVFYRQFLNSNQKKHWSYNLEWYRRHFGLVPLEVRALLSRLKITLFKRPSEPPT